MPDFIVNTVRALNAFIWGAPAIIAIIGVGAFLTVSTRFIQVRKFGTMLREIFGKAIASKESAEGSIHPFHAACTALAGTVGTGNIAGVAGAIALGGPGAIFWMWCAALLGMATKFVEIVSAVRYRERNPNGEWVGGPMYAIKNGLGRRWMWLAYAYAAFGICATFGVGNTTQANTICSSFATLAVTYADFGPSGVTALNWTIGVILVLLLGAVLLGGIKRLGAVTGRMVPVMAFFYIFLALGVKTIERNLSNLKENNARVIHSDYESLLNNYDDKYDIVFLDPPYVMTDLREVMTQIECLLAEDGIVVIEHEAKSSPVVSDHYDVFKERNWGYCGISIYQLNSRSEHAERRGEE